MIHILPKANFNLIESIKQVLSIEQAARRYVPGLILKQRGRRLWGYCPFHSENTPSFVIMPDSNRFKCFGCSEHGDSIDLVAKTLRLPLADTLQLLASDLGIVGITDIEARREVSRKIHIEQEQRKLLNQYEARTRETFLRLQKLQGMCLERMKQLTPESLEPDTAAGLILLTGHIEILINALLDTNINTQVWAVRQGRDLLELWDY